MKNSKKFCTIKSYIVSFLLLICFIFNPFGQTASARNPKSGGKKPSISLAATGTIAAGAVATGALVAGLVAYFKAKNRDVSSEPTSMDFTTFGNDQGQPIVYSHGFGGNLTSIYYYTKQQNPFQPHYLFDTEKYNIATFNYPDSTPIKMKVKYDQVTLGQEQDINRLNDAINRIPSDNVVGFGISRGAATYINMMGTVKNPKIKALILEAPFATIPDVLTHFIKQAPIFNYMPLLGSAAHKLASALFPQYKEKGVQPIDAIDQIDPEIPILLLHSTNDGVTPPNSSEQMYIKRLQQGCIENTYFVKFPSGRHVECLWQTEDKVGETFQGVVHAFLKKYGYPHEEKFAKDTNLKDYQPTIKKVLEGMVLPEVGATTVGEEVQITTL